MSIDISRYVRITSAVAATGGVPQRELILRLFSENPLVPTDAIVEFTSAADVGAYFGTSSVEYLRAQAYFAFVSKSLSRPQRISFGRHARTASPARIYGTSPVATLLAFQSITAGTLSLTIGAETANLTGLNFAAAVSLANVASILQTAIQGATGDQFATATVAYDALSGSFNFVATATETDPADISVDAGAAGSIATAMGWAAGAIFSPATPVQTITEALDASVEISNNFGSFAFVITSLSVNDTIEAATWNAARNVEFLFLARTSAANAVALSAAVYTKAGTGLTLAPLAAEYPEQLPAAILAATDYRRVNAVQSYMYQTADLTASVTTDALANLYDPLRVNYYGQTQTAGTNLSFYQRGVLMGPATAPVDMNVYANEIWFKDAATAAIMALLLALPEIPANSNGRAQILAILQDPINRALNNGTISVGKTLTVAQRLYVTELTDDPEAYAQVESVGYWLDCVIEPRAVDDRTEYVAVYTLVYGKDDTVRKVEGTHILV